MLLLPTSVLACRRAVLRAMLLLPTIATVLLSGRGRAIAVLALEGLLCCGQSVKGTRGWSCDTHRCTAHQPANHSSKAATTRRLVAVALIATAVVVASALVVTSAVATAAATTEQSTERAESAA